MLALIHIIECTFKVSFGLIELNNKEIQLFPYYSGWTAIKGLHVRIMPRAFCFSPLQLPAAQTVKHSDNLEGSNTYVEPYIH